jgi:hypothetical protein
MDTLPQQMIPLKDKLKKGTDTQKSFGQECMDALENIGRQQHRGNLRFIENYEMIKGRFIFSHYFQTEGYDSSLTKLAAEFELPNYLRHYDIISPVINTLSGEYQKRPDIFKVRQMGEQATNEYLRTKKDLLQKYVFGKINAEINARLLAEGMDPDKQDFINEEEAAAYKQQIEEYKQQLTPPEIQKFMNTDFLTLAELWAEHERQFVKEYFNLPEKEKVEFEDMLIADRCYRHYYLTPGGVGYNQETWNPINVFTHKSPDIIEAENGDYIGRIFYLSLNTIIDRYGHRMSKEDFEFLTGKDKNKKSKFNDSKFDWVYDNYFVPFQGYPTYDLMRNSWNVSPESAQRSGEIPQLDEGFFNRLASGQYFNERPGYYFVTEGYWMSQKKIIKITYLDQETGQQIVNIVDENYIIPDHFVESDNIFADDHDNNTYVETWIPEVWRGVKINTAGDKSLVKDIYLGIGPNDFQFKGDNNLYGSKLPVCGQIFSVRNSRSMSLVDMMKPHQIGYNVAMNQLYQLAEKEIGMFIVMDVNMFPNSKDWGGEDAWEKWMIMAKNFGILPADTSPANVQGSLAATGGQFPKVMNLDLASQMVSRMNMAKFFEEQAMKQVGFNNYRLGNFAQTSTATGITEGQAASYAQTESYFTNFSNYLRRCITMELEMAQYVQSQKDEIMFTYTKGDLSKAFVKLAGIDIMLAELGVLVSNSQEYIRQLDMMRQYALSNNTSGMSGVDVADVIMMNSPQEIRRQLQISLDKLMAQQQQAQEAQNQIAQQANELKAQAMQKQEQQFYDKLENDLDEARIQAGADIINTDQPEPQAPDNTGAQVSRQNAVEANSIKREQLALSKQKQLTDTELRQRELALKQAKINADLEIQRQESLSAKIMQSKTKK